MPDLSSPQPPRPLRVRESSLLVLIVTTVSLAILASSGTVILARIGTAGAVPRGHARQPVTGDALNPLPSAGPVVVARALGSVRRPAVVAVADVSTLVTVTQVAAERRVPPPPAASPVPSPSASPVPPVVVPVPPVPVPVPPTPAPTDPPPLPPVPLPVPPVPQPAAGVLAGVATLLGTVLPGR